MSPSPHGRFGTSSSRTVTLRKHVKHKIMEKMTIFIFMFRFLTRTINPIQRGGASWMRLGTTGAAHSLDMRSSAQLSSVQFNLAVSKVS